MNSDSYFRISQKTATHPVCQDYAQSGSTEASRYAIIADGCSSAKDTDFGSRLLVRSLVNSLGRYVSLSSSFQAAVIVADTCRRTIGLPPESLHATLLCVVEREGTFEVGVYGDGYVVARNRDKSLRIFKHEFESNAPYYLSYTIQPDSNEKYAEKFGNSSVVISKYSRRQELGQEIFEKWSEESYSILKGMELNTYSFDRSEWDLVAVLSDGLGSFYKTVDEGTSRTDVPIGLEHLIPELFKFKGTAGSFVLRRSIKAFEAFEDLGWKNADDFSFGVVCND